MDKKVEVNEVKIPEKIVQTFYCAFYRTPGSKWCPLSPAPGFTKEEALLNIESMKKYDSFNDAEYRVIRFDIETKI